MKRFLIILIALLFSVSPAFAEGPYLACNPPDSTWLITQSEVEVWTNKPAGPITIQPGLGTIVGSSYRLLDLENFASGHYGFRARWATLDTWWSDWSDPYDATKPESPGSLQITY